jgi:hypothetical protein
MHATCKMTSSNSGEPTFSEEDYVIVDNFRMVRCIL